MVQNTRQLERALGSGNKFVTITRSNRDRATALPAAARDIQAGETLTREMIAVLRPATPGAIEPHEIENVLGLRAIKTFSMGRNYAGPR
jgi:N-acetylneuraminate synthase